MFTIMEDVLMVNVAPAAPADLPGVLALLHTVGLPTSGVAENIGTFVVAHDGGRVVACGGAEAHEFAALIRSVAVDPEYQHHGLGRRIVRELLDRLASRGLREFYLLTTTAEEFFRKRGFRVIDRDEVHPQLLGSTEFNGACPETAICMRLVMR
ncbi:MAG: arsenic resistance N-acetyltransferase ArsN2 [Thermoanaerobaculia bacterium]